MRGRLLVLLFHVLGLLVRFADASFGVHCRAQTFFVAYPSLSSSKIMTTMRRFNSLRELDDSTMKDLLFRPTHGKSVLVEACAPWCGPCKLIEPYLVEAAKKYSEHLSVIKYNVEGVNAKDLKLEMLLQGVHVRALPTLLLYHNGVPLETHSGAMAKQYLFDWLDNNLTKITKNALEMNRGMVLNEVERKNDARNEEVISTTGGKRGFVSLAERLTF